MSVHSPGFRASADEEAARPRWRGSGSSIRCCSTPTSRSGSDYENAGWPGRYLWGPAGTLVDYHYGEGAYAECERAICELLGIACEPLAPLRPEDAPDALLVVPSEDRLVEPFSGSYEAAPRGRCSTPGRAGRRWFAPTVARSPSSIPARFCSVEHDHHTAGELALELGSDVRCDGVCFTPGLAAAGE